MSSLYPFSIDSIIAFSYSGLLINLHQRATRCWLKRTLFSEHWSLYAATLSPLSKLCLHSAGVRDSLPDPKTVCYAPKMQKRAKESSCLGNANLSEGFPTIEDCPAVLPLASDKPESFLGQVVEVLKGVSQSTS